MEVSQIFLSQGVGNLFSLFTMRRRTLELLTLRQADFRVEPMMQTVVGQLLDLQAAERLRHRLRLAPLLRPLPLRRREGQPVVHLGSKGAIGGAKSDETARAEVAVDEHGGDVAQGRRRWLVTER